ncbi:hypothetical protein [Daejeonella sp.]
MKNGKGIVTKTNNQKGIVSLLQMGFGLRHLLQVVKKNEGVKNIL